MNDESVPQLLRPVIEEYLERQLAEDADLAEAVAATQRKRARDNTAATVTSLSERETRRAPDE